MILVSFSLAIGPVNENARMLISFLGSFWVSVGSMFFLNVSSW